mgnify:CR=1 FL=1
MVGAEIVRFLYDEVDKEYSLQGRSCAVRRIVLDAQYSVMTSALTMALKHGRPDFQVQNAGPTTKDIVKLCRSCRADVLLLEVCPHPPRTLQDRLLLAKDLRDVCPHCKTVLLVDEAEYPELATAVCLAKRITLSMISSTLPSRLPI